MLVSKCCKERVEVENDCFVCDACGRICNTLTPWALGNEHDTERMHPEIEAVFN